MVKINSEPLPFCRLYVFKLAWRGIIGGIQDTEAQSCCKFRPQRTLECVHAHTTHFVRKKHITQAYTRNLNSYALLQPKLQAYIYDVYSTLDVVQYLYIGI